MGGWVNLLTDFSGSLQAYCSAWFLKHVALAAGVASLDVVAGGLLGERWVGGWVGGWVCRSRAVIGGVGGWIDEVPWRAGRYVHRKGRQSARPPAYESPEGYPPSLHYQVRGEGLPPQQPQQLLLLLLHHHLLLLSYGFLRLPWAQAQGERRRVGGGARREREEEEEEEEEGRGRRGEGERHLRRLRYRGREEGRRRRRRRTCRLARGCPHPLLRSRGLGLPLPLPLLGPRGRWVGWGVGEEGAGERLRWPCLRGGEGEMSVSVAGLVACL